MRRRSANRQVNRCVAFVVDWIGTVDIYAPVIRTLREADWTVAVVVNAWRDVLRRFSDEEYDHSQVSPTWEWLAARGFAPEPLVQPEAEAARLRELAPVAVFLPTPYEGQRQRSLAPARLGLPVHYVNYGFNINRPDRGLEFDLPFYRQCESVYAENDYCTERYARAGVERSRIVKSGSPALDHWDIDRTPAEVPTILWCPHWSIRWGDAGASGYSTFIDSYATFLAEAARRPHMRFIIRTHPLLWSELRRERLWTADEENRFHATAAELSNVVVDGDFATTTRYPRYESHLEQFEQAWAMVTDGISFLAEFAYTGKPVLLTQARGNPGWNPVGQAIVDVVERSDGIRGLASFLDRVERGIDSGAGKRREVIRGLFYRPPGGSAAAIVRHLDDQLSAAAS